jgi:septal ring factor EnvC (AmiA/AmiB activator)
VSLIDDILQGLPVNSLLREQVSQLNAQKAAIETELAIAKDDKHKLQTENADLKKQIKELSHIEDSIEETEIELLRLISRVHYNNASVEMLATLSKLHSERATYYLKRLCDLDYLTLSPYTYRYSFTHKGREYLIKNNLI